MLSACKIEVTVPKGGQVASESGAYFCGAEKTCVIDVVDTNFTEVFIAQPNEGFIFVGWKKRDRGLFGGNTSPEIEITTTGFVGNEALIRVLESDEIFYLEPVFERVLDPARFEMVDNGWILTESTPWTDSTPFQADPAVMDVDQDGLPDIIHNGPLYDEGWIDRTVPFRWLRNEGDGTFSEGNQNLIPPSAALTHTRHMSVADFNGDGLDDMVAVSHGFDEPPYPGERNLILMSTPGQRLSDSERSNPEFDYLGFTHGLDTGDINGDGVTDIVTLELFTDFRAPQEHVRLLINDGTGNFIRDESSLQVNEFTGTLDVALKDLNGDGADELIFGSWNEDQENQIFWNDGSGTYDADPTVLPRLKADGMAQYDTLAVATMDLNSDGLLDLILSVSRSYEGGYIQFLVNNGDQTFTDETKTYGLAETYPGPPPWLYVADFNGDKRDDLLTGATSCVVCDPNFNILWLRTTDGKFEKYPLPLNEYDDWGGGTWPVDYDLDGDIDLVLRYPLRFYDGYDEFPKWRTLENKLIDD